MHFHELKNLQIQQVLPGCNARFVHTENMTVSYWDLEYGAVIPPHSHPHEQVTNLIIGKLELTVGDETNTIGPGAIITIPGNVEHSVKALEPSYVIDAFSPAREDYK
jgi:quercetin dioxygenase-like cupin family protein